jgi:hypothetical protein
VRERSRTVLARDGAGPGEEACELAVRLALSYVVAPAAGDGEARELGAVLRRALSATSPTAADR